MRRQLDYVCLQPIRTGQASFAHVNEIVAGLQRRGWDVRVIEVPLPRSGRADGIRRAIAAMATQIRYWARCRFRPAAFVYVRGHYAALPTAAFARAAGAIVVQEVNGPIEDAYDAWPRLRGLDRVISISLRTQFRWADAVIAVTPGLAGYVAALTGRRDGYHVVGNGADVDRFRPAAVGIGIGRQPYVVFSGALASWQGIDTLLAAAEAPSWPAGVDVVIAGDGRERGRVEIAARSNARIRRQGTVSYDASAALVAGSLAALVPLPAGARSRTGVAPLKFFEAMACGVPVVASDLPDIGEIVREHGCGLTFPAGDPDALARCVAELAADPGRARQMGARGREAAVALYSWDARAGQTEQVLKWAAQRHRARGRTARRKRHTS